MSDNSRLARTSDLVRINSRAAQVYNRYLTEDVINSLDPEGFHIVTDVLVHSHAHGYKIAPHLRTRVLLKTKGSKEPLVTMLDMEFEDFETLPKAQRLLDDVLASEA